MNHSPGSEIVCLLVEIFPWHQSHCETWRPGGKSLQDTGWSQRGWQVSLQLDMSPPDSVKGHLAKWDYELQAEYNPKSALKLTSVPSGSSNAGTEACLGWKRVILLVSVLLLKQSAGFQTHLSWSSHPSLLPCDFKETSPLGGRSIFWCFLEAGSTSELCSLFYLNLGLETSHFQWPWNNRKENQCYWTPLSPQNFS